MELNSGQIYKLIYGLIFSTYYILKNNGSPMPLLKQMLKINKEFIYINV